MVVVAGLVLCHQARFFQHQQSLHMTKFTTASNVVIPEEYFRRIKTGNNALDTLFGDGLLPGSVITLSAKHGTGKTQFCLQLLNMLSRTHRVGYVSNEENIEQLAFTCKRIGTYDVPVANVKDVDDVVKCVANLDLLVVDSFSKLEFDGVTNRRSEKMALDGIIQAAKQSKCCVILITHNTKSGQSKGSSLVQHDVDATLYIEKNEDSPDLRRVWFEKNRFGAPGEIYIEMTASGFVFELMDAPDSQEQEPVIKESKTSQLYKSIEQFVADKFETSAADVARSLNIDYSKTQVLLRELCNMSKISKLGRGKDATYTIYELVK